MQSQKFQGTSIMAHADVYPREDIGQKSPPAHCWIVCHGCGLSKLSNTIRSRTAMEWKVKNFIFAPHTKEKGLSTTALRREMQAYWIKHVDLNVRDHRLDWIGSHYTKCCKSAPFWRILLHLL